MPRRVLLSIFLLLLATTTLHAQKTIDTWALSSQFNGVAGSPRVIWNDSDNCWIVAWRQPDSPNRIVSRVIKLNRKPGPLKTLATGISASSDNFDLAYSRISRTYLLAYETPEGLKVQLLNQQQLREGPPVLMESGVKEAHPRVILDSQGTRFFVLWVASKDGVPAKILKIRKVDLTGRPESGTIILRNASNGMQIQIQDVSFNPKNGNVFVTIVESIGSSGTILGLTIGPDGKLLNKSPLVFSSNAENGASAHAAFSRAGTGVGVWNQAGTLQFRQLSATGAFLSPAAVVTSANPPITLQSDILLDLARNRFVVSWIQNGEVHASALNAAGTAVSLPPFLVARSNSDAALHLKSSLYPQRGAVLAVWEDTTGSQFRVRAALFFVAGFETFVRGTVQLVKLYYPPLKVEDDYYYIKYHIRNVNGKQLRAYVTQETEFIGAKPRLGNTIEMFFEPGKSPTRGYIESIRIVQ